MFSGMGSSSRPTTTSSAGESGLTASHSHFLATFASLPVSTKSSSSVFVLITVFDVTTLKGGQPPTEQILRYSVKVFPASCPFPGYLKIEVTNQE